MSKINVYAIFDGFEDKLYQFASPETVLAKDAVNAFIEEQAKVLTLTDEMSKTVQTNISATSSIEELTAALFVYDLQFSMIQVG